MTHDVYVNISSKDWITNLWAKQIKNCFQILSKPHRLLQSFNMFSIINYPTRIGNEPDTAIDFLLLIAQDSILLLQCVLLRDYQTIPVNSQYIILQICNCQGRSLY
jgi:hypothetical protein